MTRRWVDRAALVVALAFLVAAVLLGLVWTDQAGAAVNQRVLTKKATHLVYVSQKKIWRHNLPRARAFAIKCWFDDVKGKGASERGVPTSCVFRAYRRTNFTGRILRLDLDLTVTIRQPQIEFEDGSTFLTYSHDRSLHTNPRAPH